jgi:hypothetical protein
MLILSFSIFGFLCVAFEWIVLFCLFIFGLKVEEGREINDQ